MSSSFYTRGNQEVLVFQFKMHSFFRNVVYVLAALFVYTTFSNAYVYFALNSNFANSLENTDTTAEEREKKQKDHKEVTNARLIAFLCVFVYFGVTAATGVHYMRRMVKEIHILPQNRVRITTMGFPFPSSREYSSVHSILPSYALSGSLEQVLQPLLVVDGVGTDAKIVRYKITPTMNNVEGTSRMLCDTLLTHNTGDSMDLGKLTRGVARPFNTIK